MQAIGIELCDCGILAALHSNSQTTLIPLEAEVIYASSAFACYDGQTSLFGQSAEDNVRLYPKGTSTHFWHNLSLEDSEIKIGDQPMLYSELAYHHFKHIWQTVLKKAQPEKVMLALPGSMLINEETQGEDEEKTGIILGIAADLKTPLVGIVDLACAAFASGQVDQEITSKALYLDLQQHSISLSILAKKGHQLHLEKVVQSSTIGRVKIIEMLMSQLANHFLEETAFDATHNLETEQVFYNQVKKVLAVSHQKGETVLSIEGKKKTHRLSVSYHDLCQKFESVYEAASQLLSQVKDHLGMNANSYPLFLSKRMATLPGLMEKCAANNTVNVLSEGSSAYGAARLASQQPTLRELEDTPLFKYIEYAPQQPHTRQDTEKQKSISRIIHGLPYPTHIVHQGIALPIDIASDKNNSNETMADKWPFSVIQEQKGLALQVKPGEAVMLNQQPIKAKEKLNINDSITTQKDGKTETFLVIYVPS